MASNGGNRYTRRGFLRASAMGAGIGLAASAQASDDAAAWPELIGEIAPWAPTTERKVRVGVVGGGFGAAWHWHEHPNCIVEAVSDLIPGRLDRLMAKYECAKSYESLEKLVLDPAIEAVAVFTPAPRSRSSRGPLHGARQACHQCMSRVHDAG